MFEQLVGARCRHRGHGAPAQDQVHAAVFKRIETRQSPLMDEKLTPETSRIPALRNRKRTFS